MRNRKCIIALILAMASLPLSIPSFSQDKDLLAKADSLYKQGRYLYDKEFYEEAINYLEEAAGISRSKSDVMDAEGKTTERDKLLAPEMKLVEIKSDAPFGIQAYLYLKLSHLNR